MLCTIKTYKKNVTGSNCSVFCPAEVVTRLSEVCCQQVVKDGALPVIFKVIKKCNRSLPHLEVIKNSLSILYNVAKVRKHVSVLTERSRGSASIEKGAKNRQDGYWCLEISKNLRTFFCPFYPFYGE